VHSALKRERAQREREKKRKKSKKLFFVGWKKQKTIFCRLFFHRLKPQQTGFETGLSNRGD
jgi:hypothetical protein